MRPLLLLPALALGLSACATLPDAPRERGLYVDVRKAVEFEEEVDWTSDRLEVEEVLPNVMGSVCRTSPETRRNLIDWLDVQITAEGGPAEELYEREGRDRTGDVKRVQTLERTRALLLRAHELADAECPFWLEEEPDFRGLQSDEGRVVVLLESMGGAALTLTDGQTAFGGGGVGRLLLAGGLSRRLTLGVGFGVGADGDLPETETGGRAFEAVVAFQVPLLLRVNFISRIFDAEIDITSRMRDGVLQTPGIRFAFAYGLSAPRTAGLMPYILAWVGYEVIPGRGADPTSHILWLGSKVGFNWDP
ncbi:MAG: hypothetical protein IPH72_34940 [Sandaracinaceae bacterium]|nr:hypothetical protein [Sandaracinaceae bacterium]